VRDPDGRRCGTSGVCERRECREMGRRRPAGSAGPDVQIGSGLFYLGDALTMPDARVIDQYAVNPDLSVSSGRGTRQAVDAVLALVVDHSCVGDRAVNPTGFWYYAASFGITLSTNRKNRLFRAPATTDSCETPIPGTDVPFRRDRVLHVPATK
jgi:hypothetical protein